MNRSRALGRVRTTWRNRVLGTALLGCGILPSCSAEDARAVTLLSDASVDLGLSTRTWTSDVWQVMTCKVPAATGDALFAASDQRSSFAVADLVEAVEPVREYFARWSQQRYVPEFTPGPVIEIGVDDRAQTCMDRALDASSPRATGVLVVADALHGEDQPGGWTQPGGDCGGADGSCPARRTRRAVYLGANDFWDLGRTGGSSSVIPLDLLEHEMGHALGWPHSSRSGSDVYDSVIDVMSDSAAPRRLDATRRHGPGVLAFHRLGAGWLDPSRVAVVAASAGGLKLEGGSPRSASADGALQLLVVPVSDQAVVTVEVVIDAGDGDHLARSGVAVHLVEWSPDVCPAPHGACFGVDRRVRLLSAAADGLLVAGDSIDVRGWRIEVTSVRVSVNQGSAASGSPGRVEALISVVSVRG